MARQTYIAFDFANFTEQGLRKVAREFEKNDAPVIKDGNEYSITATNKISRIQGMPTKSATLHFEDGQSVTLTINNEGSVFRVKLNNKTIPVFYVSSFSKSIAEISDKLKANSKKFAQAVKRKAARAHDADQKIPKHRSGNSIPARLKAATAELENARAELAEVQQQAQEQQEKASQVSQRVNQIKQKIQQAFTQKEALLHRLETLNEKAA